MTTTTPDQVVMTYLDHLGSQGRSRSCGEVAMLLSQYVAFLARTGQQPATASTADAEAFQAFLATPAAAVAGRPLAVTTQATRLGVVRAFHRWLKRRGLAIANPTRDLHLPRIDSRRVRKDFLTLQEAQAYLATASADVEAADPGSKAWASAMRYLAMVALSLATARRRSGLCDLLLGDLNVERKGLRVEREKGFAGRVLPVVGWAVDAVVAYRDQARPIILGTRTSPWLFVGQRGEHIGKRTWDGVVHRIHQETITACPDLTDLPGKNISTHCLRVTTARLLFLGGCPIRIINELMLHRRLSTTAAYTPLDLDDLRRAVLAAHPRA